jgi:hypothetical protein
MVDSRLALLARPETPAFSDEEMVINSAFLCDSPAPL